MSLGKILERYSQPTTLELGPKPSAKKAAPPPPDRDALKADLNKVQERNRLAFWVAVGIIILLILVSVGQLWLNVQRPEILKGVTAFIGVSASAMAIWLVRLWRERLAVETLLVLATYGNDEALRLLLDWWAHKLKSFL